MCHTPICDLPTDILENKMMKNYPLWPEYTDTYGKTFKIYGLICVCVCTHLYVFT